MGFFSDIKFLTNLLRKYSTITDIIETLEEECKDLSQESENLKKVVSNLKSNIEEIVKLEEGVKKSLEKQKQNLERMESQNYIMQNLESVEYIKKLLEEKDYEIVKVDLRNESYKTYLSGSYLCYNKIVFLRTIKFKIQEFAACENLSYEKLKKALFDINSVWLDTYNAARDDISEGAYTTKLLLTSFMLLQKKSVNKKGKKDVVVHELLKN